VSEGRGDADLGEVEGVVGARQAVEDEVGAEFGLGGRPVTLPAARLYPLDEDDRIKAEEVVVFAVPN
jgi:hypothetical protein